MRILLAHDGSANADTAADLVRALSWPAGSVVRVVSVIEPTMVALTAWAGTVADYSPETDQKVTDYYRGELAETVDRLSDPNRSVEGGVLRGRPASVILDEIATFGADLVVVGSRGHGAIASLLLGSVSAELVDHATCPVLVARQATLSQVVFATDDSPSAARAERLLAQWPVFENVPIRVVSVADVPQPIHTGIAPTMYAEAAKASADDLAESKKEHARIIDEAVARLHEAGRDAAGDARVGDAPSEIMASAADAKADLIVLGSRGRTGLTRLLLGSVARNVLHGSTASVLVVRDTEPASG